MKLDYAIDKKIQEKVKLGLIVLHVAETIESEFRILAESDHVSVYTSRVESGAELNEHSIKDMYDRLPATVRLLPPAVNLDVIGYACTSGATILGSDNVSRAIRSAHGTDYAPYSAANLKTTDPLKAARAAFEALGIRKLAFITPYIESVSAAMRQAFEQSGVSITSFGSFEECKEHVVANISNASIYQGALDVCGACDCDAVFLSCTNLRTIDVLEPLEQALGIPVISSNQALAWHMLRLAGVQSSISGLGQLMRTPL